MTGSTAESKSRRTVAPPATAGISAEAQSDPVAARVDRILHDVPLIENPPLAQALYKSVEVGQEIPPHLYRAVAEILAYIFKLMNGRLPG